MRKLIAPLLGAVCLLGAIGCAGTESTLLGAHNPRVRFVNASSSQNVNAYVNNEQIGSTVAFGETSSEGIFTNGTKDVTVKNASDSTVLASEDILFELNTNYTVVGYTKSGSLRLFNYRDNEDTTFNKGEIRIIRATDAFGDVDVYIFAGEDQGGTPTFTLDAVGESTDVIALDPGTYKIRIYRRGETVNPLINQNIVVTAEKNVSYLFGRTPAGVDTLLSFQDN
jgi:hypothetical protein